MYTVFQRGEVTFQWGGEAEGLNTGGGGGTYAYAYIFIGLFTVFKKESASVILHNKMKYLDIGDKC